MAIARKLLSAVLLLAILALTWGVRMYHVGVFPRPESLASAEERAAAAEDGQLHWIGREKLGINQVILSGAPYARGLQAGHATRHLLYRQEKELTAQLDRIFPSHALQRVLEALAIRWFWGIERYFEPWMTEEMYGVAQSTSREFDYLGDGFSRQIAYHGLHEVGQMMVDRGSEAMGCTVAAIPVKGSWVLGRNFDFEGGRVFDSEKIMKWVFPDRGYAYLSVVWAGMVGAVTGVNEHGLYLSINAAGSGDFRRHGTPSTLVLLKALQFARNAEEALEILRKETMFITDIFVLLDSRAGKLYRIEKSPDHTEILPLTEPSIVANHLVASRWKDDSVNAFRRDELTSRFRQERGEALLRALTPAERSEPAQASRAALRILRDKGEKDGRPLHLGNRRAIDALIATHAVVFDAPEGILYVSRGPGLAGPLLGFDLRASFAARQPVLRGELPRDPAVSDVVFEEVKASAKALGRAELRMKKKDCAGAEQALEEAARLYREQHGYYADLGEYLDRCRGDREGARKAWARALELVPAYPAQERQLRERLESSGRKPGGEGA